jgi:hypothetical protein
VGLGLTLGHRGFPWMSVPGPVVIRAGGWQPLCVSPMAEAVGCGLWVDQFACEEQVLLLSLGIATLWGQLNPRCQKQLT